MQEALKEARLAFDENEVPVGCVIVKNGEIISRGHNQNIFLKDATAHSEILAIRKANKLWQNHRLDDCDLYVSLEPCAMCAGAIALSRIRRLYYGASDKKSGGVENGARVFSQRQCHHKPEIYGGIGAIEAEKLMKKFFITKRLDSENGVTSKLLPA